MANTIRKVVIPVAGLGSRFLPVTKAVPKELLPIVDKPIIQFIVEEAIAAGLETVVFVTSGQKTPIENYFDGADLGAFKIKSAQKEKLIEDVVALSERIDIISVRQHSPKGLGHAIYKAAPIIGDESFAVMLGDDILVQDNPTSIGQCVRSSLERDGASVVGVIEVPKSDVSMYGILDPSEPFTPDRRTVAAKRFIEKPSVAEAPSNWALPGRYVFTSQIMDSIRNTPPGRNNEIQLTDAMDRLLQSETIYAEALTAERFDTGDKLGYIKANVTFGLNTPGIDRPLKEWLKDLLK